MEDIGLILEVYYTTLYWKAFFYGIFIPTVMFSVYYYMTMRVIKRQFDEHLARLDQMYNEYVIEKYKDQNQFLESLIKKNKDDS